MAADAFIDLLNAQIGHEFAAHNQYVAIAVHYDALTMPLVDIPQANDALLDNEDLA